MAEVFILYNNKTFRVLLIFSLNLLRVQIFIKYRRLIKYISTSILAYT